MSYKHIRRLALVQDEYRVSRLAVQHLEKGWPSLHRLPAFDLLSLSQVQRSSASLEATYIIRLFSEFEAILRDHLPHRSPSQPDRRSVYTLIDKAASVQRIPTAVRDGVQAVREFRNRAVHGGGVRSAALGFDTARASLNTFLMWLP